MRREEQINLIAHDCVYFKGDKPCIPHKRQGMVCRCSMYSPTHRHVLIIQLSSPLTVIRSTALIHRLKADDPDCRITYLTPFSQLLPSDVDEIITPDAASILYLQMSRFDTVFNLDMDRRACAVANIVNAEQKKGFVLCHSQPHPADHDAQGSYLRKIMPDAWPANQQTQVCVMLQMCGLEYLRETPKLQLPTGHDSDSFERSEELVVGICTNWTDQSCPGFDWPIDHWTALIEMLQDFSITAVLIGDQQANRFNQRLAQQAGVSYPGPLDWDNILSEIAFSDLLISTSPVIAEAALAADKQALLLSRDDSSDADIATYHGRGTILHSQAKDDKADFQHLLTPQAVFKSVLTHLNQISDDGSHSGKWDSLAAASDVNLLAVRTQVQQARQHP